MKFSSFLPILTAANRKKTSDRKVSEPFVASEVTQQCSDQVPNLGGIFETTNNGSNGTFKLDR